MDQFDGGYHNRLGGGGQQPNGIVPVGMGRPQFPPQALPENPHNFGIGNGSAGGAPYNSNPNNAPREMQADVMGIRGGERGLRDQAMVPTREPAPRSRDSRPRLEREARDNKAIPKMFKIAVVGDSTAGKTAICHAVTLESYNFNKNYHLTCGVGIHPKSIKLPEPIEGQDDRVNMILVDSSGKDIYREYLPKYWDKLNGMVLVIDLTSKTSLGTATEWVQLAKGSMSQGGAETEKGGGDSTSSGGQSGGHGSHQGQGQPKNVIGVLIGNKIDLTERRQISPKAAQEFATKNNLMYFECSVKDNSGLEEPFFYLAHQWVIGSLGGSSSGGGGGGRGQQLSRTSSQDKENLSDDPL